MAKKGNRVQVILECTEHKTSGMPGTSRYITTKNKKNTPERIELKKELIEFHQDLKIFSMTPPQLISNLRSKTFHLKNM